jgi:hypothetical protein
MWACITDPCVRCAGSMRRSRVALQAAAHRRRAVRPGTLTTRRRFPPCGVRVRSSAATCHGVAGSSALIRPPVAGRRPQNRDIVVAADNHLLPGGQPGRATVRPTDRDEDGSPRVLVGPVPRCVTVRMSWRRGGSGEGEKCRRRGHETASYVGTCGRGAGSPSLAAVTGATRPQRADRTHTNPKQSPACRPNVRFTEDARPRASGRNCRRWPRHPKRSDVNPRRDHQ